MKFRVLYQGLQLWGLGRRQMFPCLRSRMNTTSASNIEKDLLLSGNTIKQLKEDLRIRMGAEKGYKMVHQSRVHLNTYLPADVAELPHRNVKDSFLYGVIPLSTDENLYDRYIDTMGEVRLGRLMEDLDIFAVMVLHRYILNPKVPPGQPYPYTIVTVSISSIQFTEYKAKAAEDIRISGHVTNVGTSSATVAVWLEQFAKEKWNRITQSNVVLAARDATNTHAVVINPMKPANAKEEALVKTAFEQKKTLLSRGMSSLTKTVPTLEEQQLVHQLYLTACGQQVSYLRNLPPGCQWMENCVLQNTLFSFPEDRNWHNTVFGGFLIRVAMELGLALCILYTKSQPRLLGISDISFQKPIAVGSILQMHAHIVYTHTHFVQMTIYVDILSKKTILETADIFYLTYDVPHTVDSVLPITYQESMMYIDGLRHFRQMMDGTGIKFESLYSAEDLK